jgi:hypothetical protein
MPQRVQNLILALTGGNSGSRVLQADRDSVTQRQELLRMTFAARATDAPFCL